MANLQKSKGVREMATINLLKGSIQGSLGAFTGVRHKKTNVIKKKIWTKSPPSSKQTNAVRAFECLNRLSSVLAKKFWYHMGLSQGKMHKHNAVAKYLKPMVSEGQFSLLKLSAVIEDDGINQIPLCTFNQLNSQITTTFEVVLTTADGLPISTIGLIIDEHGRTYSADILTQETTTVKIGIPVNASNKVYGVTISSSIKNRKTWLHGLTIKQAQII